MKFELKQFMGRKLVYHSIFTFTEEQRDAYLEEVIADQKMGGHEWFAIEGELEEATFLAIGKRAGYKQLHCGNWTDENVEKYIRSYPDIALAASLGSRMYSTVRPDDINFRLPKEVHEENLNFDLQQFSWKCVRIE